MRAIILNNTTPIDLYNGETTTSRIVRLLTKYDVNYEILKELPSNLNNKTLIINNNLSCNYKEYHFFKSSLISIISYLIDLDEVNYLLKNGEMLYYTKRN